MSFLSPKVNPSYHILTSSFLSESPCSSSALNTSSSVNPNAVSYCFDVDVTTTRLLRSEKMLSFDIVSALAEPLEVCLANFLTAEYSAVVIPVIIALSR